MLLRRLSTAVAKPAHEVLKSTLQRNAANPLIQHLRSTWPDAPPTVNSNNERPSEELPPRTVADDKLSFQMRTSYLHARDIFYSHMKINPADYKVALFVNLQDLSLTERELQIFQVMVGTRLNYGRRELKLTAERFVNRVENKRYLVYLLEKLLAEAKRLASIEKQFDEEQAQLALTQTSSPSADEPAAL